MEILVGVAPRGINFSTLLVASINAITITWCGANCGSRKKRACEFKTKQMSGFRW